MVVVGDAGGERAVEGGREVEQRKGVVKEEGGGEGGWRSRGVWRGGGRGGLSGHAEVCVWGAG